MKTVPGRTSRTKGWLPYRLVSALAERVSWFHMARGRPARCSLKPPLAVCSSNPNKELLASMALFTSMYCSCKHTYSEICNLRAAWRKILHNTD